MSLDENETERIVFSEYHTQGIRGPCFKARSGRYKYVNVDGRDEQLYGLGADPGQWRSLVGVCPSTNRVCNDRGMRYRTALRRHRSPNALARACARGN